MEKKKQVDTVLLIYLETSRRRESSLYSEGREKEPCQGREKSELKDKREFLFSSNDGEFPDGVKGSTEEAPTVFSNHL